MQEPFQGLLTWQQTFLPRWVIPASGRSFKVSLNDAGFEPTTAYPEELAMGPGAKVHRRTPQSIELIARPLTDRWRGFLLTPR